MTNQNFKTLIQTKINALAYTSGTLQAKEVSLLAAKSVGQNVDLTNIITVYNAIASAADDNTSSKDLLYLNAASLALGVTSKSAMPKKMIMPVFGVDSHLLYLKAGNSVFAGNTSSFYSSIESINRFDYETATLQQAGNTSKQTLVDTGPGHNGVLTQLIVPYSNTSGRDVTITITKGSEVQIILIKNIPQYQAICLGDFQKYKATSTANESTGIQSAYDDGFWNSSELSMSTPLDTASKGLSIGIVFQDSLKIEMQSTAPFVGGGSTSKMVAAWLNYIPEGVL